MSQKITSKNLSYDTSLPPFLRNLHAQAGGSDQPIATGQRRAAKKRSGSEEAEDAPVVVDEDGNVVNVEVDKEGVVKNEPEPEGNDEGEKAAKKEDAGKAAIGVRKRKVGRIVGEAADESGEVEGDKPRKDSEDGKVKEAEEGRSKEKKPKKKAKKIKLSFD